MQIPYKPDYRVSGDTIDVIDKIEVPKGKWGKASYQEPLAKDYPEFGPGKASQVKIQGTIPVDSKTIRKMD